MPDIIASKYKIVREIARSNDVVYEAIDTTMGRRLAVKELVVPPNLTGQSRRERIERFNREARATGRLAHPNIVTVYDYGEDDGRYFIAMEYLEGGTLRDSLQARGAFPVHDAIDLACQVLSGLSHAHSHKVVHRDVKPDNIHILPGGQAKLTDFGIARLTEEASLTGEGQVFGTPSYMSPEQIEGRDIDHRSDLFSVGVVLYEMLAGRKPFTGDSVVTITYNIAHSDPPPLAGVPFAIEQVVFRALSKHPHTRYSSADEMRQALRNAEQNPSAVMPSAAPTGLGYIGLGAALGGTSAYGSSAPPLYPGSGATPAAPFGVPVPPPPAATGLGATAYAPPPAAAGPTGGGPFINWSAASGSAPPYVPPPSPFPRRPAAPLLSEGARTFLAVFVWAVVLGLVVIGGVVLFYKAYDKQREEGGAQIVARLNQQGKALVAQRQLEQAAAVFEEAYRRGRLLGPQAPAAQEARTDLAVTYNKLGLNAMQLQDDAKAEHYFNAVLDLYPTDAEIANDQDKLVISDAHWNLGKVYDHIGDKDRALEQWQRSNGSAQSGSGSTVSPQDSALQASYQRARTYLEAGSQAYSQGQTQQARDNWQKAIAEAPGTDVAEQAQQFLDRTTAPPSF